MLNNSLDLTRIRQPNQDIFSEMVDWYESPSNDKLLNVVKNINLINIRMDLQIVMDEIRLVLVENGLTNNANIVQGINRCLVASDYSRVTDIIKPLLVPDNPGNGVLISRLMEVCNIYRVFDKLNSMPGHKGKSVNIFKLMGFAI